MKKSKRIRISAEIHAHEAKVLHHSRRRKSRARLRHQNLTAEIRETSGWCNAFSLCQWLQSLNGRFELDNALLYELQFGLSLLQFL